MEFAAFADRAAEIEAETADNKIDAHVTDLLLAAREDAADPVTSNGDPRPHDLALVTRFIQGRVVPAWDSRTLDIGPQTCYEALARAAGRNVSPADVEAAVAEIGDIGAVAASYDLGGQQGLSAFSAGGTDALTVRETFETLTDLAAAEGAGSQERKTDLLFGLFARCSPTEARYLARLVLAEMRIGVGEGTVRNAIASAFDIPVDSVERALQVSNDYGHVAVVAHEDGRAGLDAMDLEIGRPVQAMLAQTGSVTEALTDWAQVAVEWKYDGARITLHYDGTETHVFSRNMEDVTAALPEVVEFAEATLTEPVILDGEVVAVDDDGEPRPFQAVLRRFRRKHDIDAAREDVTVQPVFFDCLRVAGEDLLEAPLTERHDRLVSVLGDDDEAESEIEGLSRLWITDDPATIESIAAEALDAGHEGLMLKEPASTYSPGTRGNHWRKRKPDVETLDCVVIGAEWGEGRRAAHLGTFVIAIRNGDDYEPIGKVATGITDETLAELTALLEPHIRTQEGQTVEIEPAVVFEVGYEEIQSSPTYASGYALRFPRFVGIRDDKDPQDVETLDRVESLVEGQ